MTEETSPPWGGYAEMGPLAAALAKAQASYPPIPRDKRVTVTSKRTGQTYSFNYAPLDTILDKVRKPLADNGLAVAQLLDGPDLVTMLLHESGASLSGRINLPRDPNGDVQQLGSAITYLRRYALQALLGIAAEEDDDGNAASGNRATSTKPAPTNAQRLANEPGTVSPAVTGPAFNPATAQDPGGLIGTADIGKADADFQAHMTPTGHRLAFSLVEGSRKIKVEALDALALQVSEYRQGIEGFRVTCWGRLRDETFTPKDSARAVTYQVLTLTRLKVGPLELTGEAVSEPLFPEAVPA